MRPFRDSIASEVFNILMRKVTAEIDSLSNDYVLNTSLHELEEYYIDKVLIDPLVLYIDQKYIKNQAVTGIDVTHDFLRAVPPGEQAIVPGTRVDIAIPFEGDPMLWRIKASVFSMGGYPEIDIHEDEIVFNVSFPDDSVDSEMLQTEIDNIIKSFTNAIERLKNDVENHNSSAPNTIRQSLERKRKLAQSVIGAVAALGIPIKRNKTEPIFTIPAKRRKSPARRPVATTGKYEPEPILDEKEYLHILEIIKSMSLVIERNPSSFKTLNEEAIRDHFLLQLNGHYEGNATGETFNASGKTDILIRVDNKNVFIAECKFWRGSKVFNSAIDQLLGYLTWRDSKCALLVFNKTKDSTAVRLKMHEVMSARSQHRKTVYHEPGKDSQYIFVKDSDPGKEIYITTQLYDLPDDK